MCFTWRRRSSCEMLSLNFSRTKCSVTTMPTPLLWYSLPSFNSTSSLTNFSISLREKRNIYFKKRKKLFVFYSSSQHRKHASLFQKNHEFKKFEKKLICIPYIVIAQCAILCYIKVYFFCLQLDSHRFALDRMS